MPRRQDRIKNRVQARDQGRRQTDNRTDRQGRQGQIRQAEFSHKRGNSPGRQQEIQHGNNAQKCLHGKNKTSQCVHGSVLLICGCVNEVQVWRDNRGK